MADTTPEFEVRELQLMRAWMAGDAGAVKSYLGGDCIMMFGTTPPVLLDRPSFVAACADRFACSGFRFHEVTARKHKKNVWFTGHVELELQLGQQEWNGHFLLTDLWRKSSFGGWKVMERSLAPLAEGERTSSALRSLQMWR